MSRAFVKEPDDLPPDAPPELQVSTHPNFVTRNGLRLIEQTLFELSEELGRDPDDITKARLLRDLRYWTARRDSAQLQPAPPDSKEAHFGSTITVRRDDDKSSHTYRIVGEDEADPNKGSISYVSPRAEYTPPVI